MYHPYLQEQVARALYQELVHEAEQQQPLLHLPRRHPRLMQAIIAQWYALFAVLPQSAKQAEPQMRTVTGKL